MSEPQASGGEVLGVLRQPDHGGMHPIGTARCSALRGIGCSARAQSAPASSPTATAVRRTRKGKCDPSYQPPRVGAIVTAEGRFLKRVFLIPGINFGNA